MVILHGCFLRILDWMFRLGVFSFEHRSKSLACGMGTFAVAALQEGDEVGVMEARARLEKPYKVERRAEVMQSVEGCAVQTAW